jgi:hypothetical protein
MNSSPTIVEKTVFCYNQQTVSNYISTQWKMYRKRRRFGTLKEWVEFIPITKHEAAVKDFFQKRTYHVLMDIEHCQNVQLDSSTRDPILAPHTFRNTPTLGPYLTHNIAQV